MVDDDSDPTRLTRSLSARLRRKEQVARGESVPDMPSETLAPGAAEPAVEPDDEAELSDEELLAKYGVEDPEVIEDETRLDTLLQGQFPDRIRQMALRRMWRLNPLFRFADEMVEYGENYTDAATVIDGMQTAYQVGKGYLQKAFDAVEDEAPDAPQTEALATEPPTRPDEGIPDGDPKDSALESRQPDTQENGPQNGQESGPENGQEDGHHSARADVQAGDRDNGDNAMASAPTGSNPDDVLPVPADEPEEPPRSRPRRMAFHRPGQ